MILETHDGEVGNTLFAVCRNLDFDYQAEQWVLDILADRPSPILWILFTDEGEPLRAWERNGNEPREIPVPPGTKIHPRSLLPRTDRKDP